jgi:hypothetical protein
MKRCSFRVLNFWSPLQRFQTHEDVVDAFEDPVLLLLCNPREQERGLIGVVSQEELTNPVFPLRRGDILPSQRGEDELPNRTNRQPVRTLGGLGHRPSHVPKPNSLIRTLPVQRDSERGFLRRPTPPITRLARHRSSYSVHAAKASSPVPARRVGHGSVSFARNLVDRCCLGGPARSDPFDVAFQGFGRLRFDALLASMDLGAVGVFDEGEGGAIVVRDVT